MRNLNIKVFILILPSDGIEKRHPTKVNSEATQTFKTELSVFLRKAPPYMI